MAVEVQSHLSVTSLSFHLIHDMDHSRASLGSNPSIWPSSNGVLGTHVLSGLLDLFRRVVCEVYNSSSV